MGNFKKTFVHGFNVYSNSPKSCIRDINLDIAERGLLLTMLSLPDDWTFSIRGLAAILPSSKGKIQRTLNNLENAGYLRRTQLKEKSGKFATIHYEFADEPVFNHPDEYSALIDRSVEDDEYVAEMSLKDGFEEKKSLLEDFQNNNFGEKTGNNKKSPCTQNEDTAQKPCLEKPCTQKRDTVNGPQYNTKVLNTNISNTKLSNTKYTTSSLNTLNSKANKEMGGNNKPSLEEFADFCVEKGLYFNYSQFFRTNELQYHWAKDWKETCFLWCSNPKFLPTYYIEQELYKFIKSQEPNNAWLQRHTQYNYLDKDCNIAKIQKSDAERYDSYLAFCDKQYERQLYLQDYKDENLDKEYNEVLDIIYKTLKNKHYSIRIRGELWDYSRVKDTLLNLTGEDIDCALHKIVTYDKKIDNVFSFTVWQLLSAKEGQHIYWDKSLNLNELNIHKPVNTSQADWANKTIGLQSQNHPAKKTKEEIQNLIASLSLGSNAK